MLTTQSLMSLLYCWFPGHKLIWNQFLISLAESSPDSDLAVTYIVRAPLLGGMPSRPSGQVRDPAIFQPHRLGRFISGSRGNDETVFKSLAACLGSAPSGFSTIPLFQTEG